MRSALLVAGLLLLAIVGYGWSSSAEQNPKGRFQVKVKPATNEKGVVTISLIRDGEIVNQSDTEIGSYGLNLHSVPDGLYDVRLEGDGFETYMKKSLKMNSRDQEVIMVAKTGRGARVVEFATGGLTREEIAKRIRTLEADVAALKQKVGT